MECGKRVRESNARNYVGMNGNTDAVLSSVAAPRTPDLSVHE